jgi:Fic family protein
MIPKTYIHQRESWPGFVVNHENAALAGNLVAAQQAGRDFRNLLNSKKTELRRNVRGIAAFEEVTASFTIEDESIDPDRLRSSLGRTLGIRCFIPAVEAEAKAGAERAERARRTEVPGDSFTDGLADLCEDICRPGAVPLTEPRLFQWHRLLFREGEVSRPGAWRRVEDGDMLVVSGPVGAEIEHYRAPSADRIPGEMGRFLAWFGRPRADCHYIVKAAIAHIWFVTIHPFADGNGRLARAVSALSMVRDDRMSAYYSLSRQILRERDTYYGLLEKMENGPTLDVTEWAAWYARTVARALSHAVRTFGRTAESPEIRAEAAKRP